MISSRVFSSTPGLPNFGNFFRFAIESVMVRTTVRAAFGLSREQMAGDLLEIVGGFECPANLHLRAEEPVDTRQYFFMLDQLSVIGGCNASPDNIHETSLVLEIKTEHFLGQLFWLTSFAAR